jgi:transposase InsO family protein
MGWKGTCVEEEKLRFIADRLRGDVPMTELCECYGVSREAGYELMRRYAAEGANCIQPRSRAPHVQAGATENDVVAALIDLREQRPHWGPKKLRAYLERQAPDRHWPAASTIGDLLKRHGLVEGRRRRRSALPQRRPFAAITAPNDLWCVDFKGWFRTGDGRRCDPLTVTDADSRYLLACRIVPPSYDGVLPVMERLFREHGLPRAIRSDNGPPFGSAGAGGLSRLAVHWLKLGVAIERIVPGNPQQNGRHERMHATLKAETARPPAADHTAQQERFDGFRTDFNEQRPHEALGQATPASRWHPSRRPYPDRIEPPAYCADHVVRRVRQNGEIKWRGELIFVSDVLAGEPVGIAETETGEFIVRFAAVDLGLINRAGTKMRRFTAPRPGRREAEQTEKSVNHVPGL